LQEWIWGKNSVYEAFRAGQRTFFEVLLASGTKDKFSFLRNEEKDFPIREVSQDKLAETVGEGQHQGIAALVSHKPYSSISEVISVAKKRGDVPFILVLDGVCDPHNLGAIIRTAEVAGVHGVVVPSHNSAGISPTVSRVSAGAMEYMHVIRETNLVRFIKKLKEDDFWVAGMFSEASDVLFESGLGTVPLALVVGGEGSGVRPLVRKHCDFALAIPERGEISSLNASVAASIAIYEVVRQRALL